MVQPMIIDANVDLGAIQQSSQATKMGDQRIKMNEMEMERFRKERQDERDLMRAKKAFGITSMLDNLYRSDVAAYERVFPEAFQELKLLGIVEPTADPMESMNDPAGLRAMNEQMRAGLQQYLPIQGQRGGGGNQSAFAQEYGMYVQDEIARGTAEGDIMSVREYREMMMSGAPTSDEKNYQAYLEEFQADPANAGQEPMSRLEFRGKRKLVEAQAQADVQQGTRRAREVDSAITGVINAQGQQRIIQRAMDTANWTNTGIMSLLNFIPGLSGNDLEADLKTINANLGFSQLQQIKESSPTGGGVGALSEREFDNLASTLVALNSSQSYERLKDNLGEVLRAYRRWADAYKRDIAQYGSPEQQQELEDNLPAGSEFYKLIDGKVMRVRKR